MQFYLFIVQLSTSYNSYSVSHISFNFILTLMQSSELKLSAKARFRLTKILLKSVEIADTCHDMKGTYCFQSLKFWDRGI